MTKRFILGFVCLLGLAILVIAVSVPTYISTIDSAESGVRTTKIVPVRILDPGFGSKIFLPQMNIETTDLSGRKEAMAVPGQCVFADRTAGQRKYSGHMTGFTYKSLINGRWVPATVPDTAGNGASLIVDEANKKITGWLEFTVRFPDNSGRSISYHLFGTAQPAPSGSPMPSPSPSCIQ
jgi:hypothetical protein